MKLNLAFKCDVCGKPPWWGLSRAGDPCPDDDGHLIYNEDVDPIDHILSQPSWEERESK